MFGSRIINTVGELKELLKQFPDDKPIIMDDEGNTWPPEFYNWAEKEDDDTNWPISIR